MIQASWSSSHGIAIQQKLLNCGTALLNWGGHLASDFRNRISDYKRKMSLLRGHRDSAGIVEFTEGRKRFNELFHSQEVFWKQRSRLLWLKEGDMNSHFFHTMPSTRKRRNSISTLRNAQGQSCTTSAEIDALIYDYFSKLFIVDGCQNDEVLNCVKTKITYEQNELLLEPFSTGDVKAALFKMHPDKSSGPDGMNPAFYQRF